MMVVFIAIKIGGKWICSAIRDECPLVVLRRGIDVVGQQRISLRGSRCMNKGDQEGFDGWTNQEFVQRVMRVVEM